MEEKRSKKASVIFYAVIILALVIGGGMAYRAQRAQQEKFIELSAAESAPEAASELVVHVAGAVRAPGLVHLPSGARVADAIKAAGGAAEGADTDALNLAAKVEDGQKIVVRAAAENPEESGSGRVNINTADAEKLKSLPGIGDVSAQNIIDYREKNGGFSAPEEIKNVTRIGDKIYERIADMIEV